MLAGAIGGMEAGYINSGGNLEAAGFGAMQGAAMGYFGSLSYGSLGERALVGDVVGGTLSDAEGGNVEEGAISGALTIMGSGGYAAAAQAGASGNAGYVLRFVMNRLETMFIRHELARYAQEHHMSLLEADVLLFGFSELGNKLVGSRYSNKFEKTGHPGITGYFTRNGGWVSNPIAARVVGGVFDVSDTLLAYQGIPTASGVDAILSGNKELWGHSLGALDVGNLQGLGLIQTSHLYELPFPYIGPGGSSVDLEYDDPISGSILGLLTNPGAGIHMPCGTLIPHIYAGDVCGN